MSDQSAPQEIVIVRRRGGDDEGGHHGGVWKIAYADFMTAMMAFFLVMWLVNASDKKVLTQVASYFNPLKMSDRVTATKGVDDMKEGGVRSGKVVDGLKSETEAEPSEDTSGTAEEKEHDEKKKKESKKEKEEESASEHKEKAEKSASGGQDMSEQELFNDPYGILEKLASQAIPGKREQTDPDGKAAGKAEMRGTAFRDPFDPDFNMAMMRKEKKPKAPDVEINPIENTPDNTSTESEAGQAESPENTDKKVENSESKATSETASGADVEPEASADDLKERLDAELASIPLGKRPQVVAQETAEGILVSLTDEFDFEMFGASSAKPTPNLVVAMRKIGKALNDMDGSIVIRGFTDSRKFKKGSSDNWVLSTQRALMSRYMLISGGLEERRVERVEGYADSVPKIPTNKFAPQNRRIEILVRKARE